MADKKDEKEVNMENITPKKAEEKKVKENKQANKNSSAEKLTIKEETNKEQAKPKGKEKEEMTKKQINGEETNIEKNNEEKAKKEDLNNEKTETKKGSTENKKSEPEKKFRNEKVIGNDKARKNNKNSKKNDVIGKAVLIIALVALVGCGIYKYLLNKQATTASQAVEGVLGAIQDGDNKTISEYLNDSNNQITENASANEEDESEDGEKEAKNEFKIDSNTAIIDYTNEEAKNNAEKNNNEKNDAENNSTKKDEKNEDNDNELLTMFSQKMTYDIKDVKANFNTATVTVDITNKNVGQVVTASLVKALQNMFNPASQSEYKVDDFAKELINSDTIESKTTSVTFNLTKENGKWKIDVNKNALSEAVWPGLTEAINSFSGED